jgi:hypothetical protein
MSKDANSRSNPTLFAEDSLVSHSPKLENSLPKTTPVTSGRKCLDLSGNAGPLGFVEKTLLGSSNWAWTKYSLTWKAKATPQGRLIYQLARLAPRTSDSGSGLLHTPTAKANQTSPSTMARGPGNWVSGLGGAKPHHMVPTPTTMDHVERKSTNKTPSTGKLNYETNKSVSLDRWAKMWPTPTTPTGGGERSGDRSGTGSLNYMARSGQLKMWPTPSAQEPGWKHIEVVDKKGNPPTHSNQRFYHKETGRVVQKGLQQVVTMEQDDPKITGSLNPQWVAWLMGYPTEYLSCVPWATRSFRKSRKK